MNEFDQDIYFGLIAGAFLIETRWSTMNRHPTALI
jgi:hypothetical protein